MFVVNFKGGLGNQLFQYAFYLMLKEKFPEVDVRIRVKEIESSGQYCFELNKLIKAKTKSLVKSFIRIDEKNFKLIKMVGDNYYFDGYWQDEKYFPKARLNLSPLLRLSIFDHRNVRILDQIKRSNSVSIHVRRGDYVTNPVHGNIANLEYFCNAIAWICEKVNNPAFYIFSNDIYWCKENLPLMAYEAHFIDWNQGRKSRIDLFLMSQCKHNIISNSSFSWWAQHMNTYPDKFVVAPTYWYNEPVVVDPIILDEKIVCLQNIKINMRKSKNPIFSIIVAIFNTAVYLRRCLTSILNQDFYDIEVICVNDASRDDSQAIIDDYALSDERIISLEHTENKGLLAVRQTGMNVAKGEYVLFVDSDDWLEKNACSVLWSVLKTNKVDILEYSYTQEPSGNIVHPKTAPNNERLKKILNSSDNLPITIWNKVYSRELVEKAKKYFKSFYAVSAEDAYYSVIFSSLSNSYEYINSSLWHYSVGTGISTKKELNYNEYVGILNSMRSVVLEVKSYIVDVKSEYSDLIVSFERRLIQDVIGGVILNRLNEEQLGMALVALHYCFSEEALAIELGSLINNYRRKIKEYKSLRKAISLKVKTIQTKMLIIHK